MPKKNSPRNLRDLCFQTISDNIDVTKNHVRKLPYSLINELYSRENNLKSKCKKLFSKIFLNRCTTELDFNDILDVNEVENFKKMCVNQICKTCEVNNVTKIHLPHDKSLNLFLQVKLIQHCQQIKSLTICTFGSNYVLSIIAKHCTQLRHLNVDYSENVTNRGIRSLCTNKNMKIVKLSIRGTKITADGCLYALRYLKFLKVLIHSHWTKLFKMLKLEINENPAYPLEVLRNNSGLTIEGINVATAVFPNLRRLTLIRINFNDIVPRINFDRITHLYVFNRIHDIDINLIGIYFPMVQSLYLSVSNITNLHNSHTSNHIPFKHLRYLHLSGVDISENVLNRLLVNSHKLKELLFTNCQTLTDDFFLSVLKTNLLYHLKKLCIYNCNFISITSFMKMLEMDSLLNYIKISKCALFNEEEKSKLQNYVEKNNLDLNFVSQG